MTIDQFKLLHSEIMMYFQCIEFDLKRIYSGMSSEDFDDEMDMLEMSNFGNTLHRLKKLDESDGDPWLSEAEYEQLDRIRESRNYWAHQCYLDYLYIQNNWERESKFQRIANRLTNECNRIRNLHQKLQDLCINWFGDYTSTINPCQVNNPSVLNGEATRGIRLGQSHILQRPYKPL